MSTTVAYRPRIRVPVTTLAIALLVGLAATAVLVLAQPPADVAVEAAPGALTAPGAGVGMPRLETHAEILTLTGRAPGARARAIARPAHRNVPVGTSLDVVRPGEARQR